MKEVLKPIAGDIVTFADCTHRVISEYEKDASYGFFEWNCMYESFPLNCEFMRENKMCPLGFR